MAFVRRSYKSARGAMLIHITIAMLAAISMSAWMVDNGVLWVARGQAQNMADAAALAGAISLAYDDPDDQAAAQNAALGAASANKIWTAFGTDPVIQATDVTFPPC